jgi:bleomycin hydrolase
MYKLIDLVFMCFRLQQLQQQVAAQIKMKGYKTNIYQFIKMTSIKNITNIILICLAALKGSAQAPFGPVRLTDSVACTAVADQGVAPVCWTFGTNSLFEADLLRTQGLRVNLSEMFYARYAYIDKAKMYLATKGKTYFEGGGQFHDVIRVIERYGMVPESAYPGKPKGRQHDHTLLDTAMQRLVKRWLRLGLTTLQPKHLRQLNDTLNKYLGKPPTRFLYNGKWHTPRSFADTYLHFTNDYLELVAFADKPLYQKHELVDRYNWAADHFYNISLADMQMVADSALAAGWSLGWEGDVTEPDFYTLDGYASLEKLPADVDDKRLANYKDLSTERDHMLHLVGAGYDSLGKRWYYQKNSWGNYNRFKGFLYMDENYFLYKTVILFVNKAALTPGLRARLGLTVGR